MGGGGDIRRQRPIFVTEGGRERKNKKTRRREESEERRLDGENGGVNEGWCGTMRCCVGTCVDARVCDVACTASVWLSTVASPHLAVEVKRELIEAGRGHIWASRDRMEPVFSWPGGGHGEVRLLRLRVLDNSIWI